MRRLFPASLFLCILSSCFPNPPLSRIADPPPTPLLSIETRWAVVSAAYVQVFDIAADNAVVLGHYRKASVLPVAERVSLGADKSWEVWLRNTGNTPGWIRERDCLLYDSEAQARTAARGLLE